MKKLIGLHAVVLLLTSCGGDNSSDEYVYDLRMPYGCDSENNLSLEESAEELTLMGVDVLSSTCAILTNISLTESCGDISGEFFIHKLREESLKDVDGSVYKSINELANHDFPERYIISDEGVSYQVSECLQY